MSTFIFQQDVLALGSFFHYAGGFEDIEAFDLTLPELNPIGRLKDILSPSPRLDFFACVHARKSMNSPHGRDLELSASSVGDAQRSNLILGEKFKPKKIRSPVMNDDRLSPYC